jgi:hypothetical protein
VFLREAAVHIKLACETRKRTDVDERGGLYTRIHPHFGTLQSSSSGIARNCRVIFLENVFDNIF